LRSLSQIANRCCSIKGETYFNALTAANAKPRNPMSAVTGAGSPIEVVSLREFFHDSVQRAMLNQHVEVEAQTEHYLVTVLTRFAHADEFFGPNADCRTQRPLAFLLADALAAPAVGEQRQRMQQLGDVALLTGGFFSQSFARKLVDVDYCIGMGARAYAYLADSWRGRARGAVFSDLFTELAAKFQRLVDVLNEVADMAKPVTDQDILRLYEIWLKTGSPRARQLLQSRGVLPVNQQAHS
jgi:hypothetical protein